MNKLNKLKSKKSESKTVRSQPIKKYLVGVCVTAFRQNLMLKVTANNDYCALLMAMKKLRAHVASMYPSKSDMIEENWEAEEKELCSVFRDYDSLKSYLCVAGFIVTTPYLLTDV